MIKKTIKAIGLCACAYVAMMLVFMVLIVGVFCIPRGMIEENARKSSELILSEGAYYGFMGGEYFMLDNFTDALMINLAVTEDYQHPFESSMQCKVTGSGDLGMPECLSKLVNGDAGDLIAGPYARYWHGNQVFLRSLLAMMDLAGIRVLNYICFGLLLLLVLFLMGKRLDYKVGVVFVYGVSLILFPMVPLSLQFSSCFYVALVSCLVILLWPDMVRDEERLSVVMFCIGGVTSYVDLMTTPLVTLGLPILVAGLLHRDNGFRRLAVGSVSWVVGYGLLWLSKWVVSSAVVGFNVVEDALMQIGVRTSTSMVCNYIFTTPPESLRITLLIVVVVLWCLVAMSYGIKRMRRDYNWLLVLALFVPTWFVAVFNHSIMHDFFTWRGFVVTVTSLAVYGYVFIKDKRNENSSSDTLL